MLELKNIVKTYVTGGIRQDALRDVSINFRENEFVAILGHSGSGKTTLLNIIGGLDRYTEGDLRINGVSTKQYKDADWDYYRNHSIGFIFQNYNLIPHQTVLANVELALTLAGISKHERRKRAEEALKKVGLSEHMHKRPNQMSGGQMQRVAIARALINNPDILLADEPTGALDSETSIQIMELLKEIARDKLVVMVTHNPELAEEYATRIVRLMDGKIVGDTNPCESNHAQVLPEKHPKISMSFLTALNLSFQNLRTKKGRTLLTAFAGSIGIIGIALILSLSNGMNEYINTVQKDTMTSYPITINAQTIDATAMLNLSNELSGMIRERVEGTFASDGVHVDYTALQASSMIQNSIIENNLTAFKKYLDDPTGEIRQYIGENGVVYGYDLQFNVYTYDDDGALIDTNMDLDANSNQRTAMMRMMSGNIANAGNKADNFSELMPNPNGDTVSDVIREQYELAYGRYPNQANEIVLVLSANGGISARIMTQLGFITEAQYRDAVTKLSEGQDADEITLSYEDICKKTYYLVPSYAQYAQNEDGTFSYIEDMNKQLENAIELKVVGILHPTDNTSNIRIMTTMAYTSALTQSILEQTCDSPVISAQAKTPDINVLNGMRFSVADDAEKIREAKAMLGNMSVEEKASTYKMFLLMDENLSASMMASDAGMGAIGQMPADMSNINIPDMSMGLSEQMPADMSDMAIPDMSMGASAQMPTDMDGNAIMAMQLDAYLAGTPNEELLLQLYDQYVGAASYEDNMKTFGMVSEDVPSSISIYVDDFESKDAIAECIERYNESVEENSRISYTDYVALLTSSLTTIIDGISYILIAFVAISLVVSCIMIGIITHISVMERTKEIGILRALGASKRNISQVFNAETCIIGCCSGVIGIGMSFILLIPINDIIERVSGIADLNAILPINAAFILIGIGIVITIIGGLLPAKKAAKKDPVVALRTE